MIIKALYLVRLLTLANSFTNYLHAKDVIINMLALGNLHTILCTQDVLD
jgi:hypothetical protein